MMRAILLTLAALTACSSPRTPDAALLLADRGGSLAEARQFQARARELGVETITFEAGDASNQDAQVELAIASGVRLLVIEPVDGPSSERFVARAHQHGSRVLAYDQAITSPDLDGYVVHDHYRVGVLQAEAALAASGAKGRYVILAGAADEYDTRETVRGYEHTLAPYVARGDVEIVMRREATPIGDALPVAAVLAMDAPLARRAIEELDAGAARAFVAGAGTDVANLNLLCQGKEAVDIYLARDLLATTAADAARKLLDGDDLARDATSFKIGGRFIPVAPVKVELITADTVKPRLVETGRVQAYELPACATQLVHR